MQLGDKLKRAAIGIIHFDLSSCHTVFAFKIQMEGNKVEEYERRLKEMPTVNREVQQDILKYQSMVDQQSEQLTVQNAKIRILETEMIKLDKMLETRENEIQELSESEEKISAKEKKYFMQIENYNKKIDSCKTETSRLQKSNLVLKRETKTMDNTIATATSEKNKVLQALTKAEIKINTFTQTLNDLKLKIMEQPSRKSNNPMAEESKKTQKQINQLFMGIKKQMALIDVLKRQKVHVVASSIFKYCEEDFEQILEMKKTTE